ncbi:tyrosine-type recombinase/integrase [Bradyrhizobium japonicum]
MLLLTAQRRDEIGLMQAEEIDGDVFVIPGDRYKTGEINAVPLTTAARQWIGDRKSGYMFSATEGKRPFSGYSKAKNQLDAVIAKQRKADELKPMAGWRLHDLRRTARSLMSRAGINSDIAELVLGHKLPGIRRVYDRYSYAAEKRDALEKLAGLISIILNPPADNVVQMGRGHERSAVRFDPLPGSCLCPARHADNSEKKQLESAQSYAKRLGSMCDYFATHNDGKGAHGMAGTIRAELTILIHILEAASKPGRLGRPPKGALC